MKPAFLALLQCIILFAAVGPFTARGDDPTSPVGLAMESIFSPLRAPENKTMGLTQRSFLDLLETSRQQLEIALVIDGTDSMRDSLAGIRQTLGSMLDDLRLYKGADVRLQIVVYRDAGSKLGEVTFPLTVAGRRFTADQEALQRAVSSIEADSGAPYFPELIDMGIQAAINELEWSDDPATTKWLLVFGDAPPYVSGFEEAETGARRRVATEQLVTQASSKQIKINCVLCTSRAEDRPAYEAVLEELRSFMGTLSAGTGGLMLDLSYPDIRRAIEEAGKKPRVAYGDVGRISEQEIRQLQDEAAQKKTLLSRARRLRIAILPHLPLDKMSFNTDLPEVQLATDLRQRLRAIPGVQIESSGVVRRQLDVLASQGIPPAAMLTTLAAMLKVDYVIWGQFAKEQDLVRVESAIYDGIGGQPLVQNAVRTSGPASGETSNELVRGLVNKAARARNDERLTTALAVLRTSPSVSTELLTRVSNRPEVEGPLLSGYESLEQALSYRSGATEADSLLNRAEAALTAAVGPAGDSQNGFGHMLLANCYFNQAMALTNRGDQAAATEKMQLFRSALNQAYQFRARVPNESDRVEIEGDFALFIRKDTAAAIKAYESIADPTPAGSQESLIRSHAALRARWMLAGIYAGDWGVEPTWVDGQKARELLLQILAYWPESSEANFIRTQLRWNEQSGQTEFAHFPHQHESVTQVLAKPE